MSKLHGIFLVLLVASTSFKVSQSQTCLCDGTFTNPSLPVYIPGYEPPALLEDSFTCSGLEFAATIGLISGEFCDFVKFAIRPPCICPGDSDPPLLETCAYCSVPFSNPDQVIAINADVQPTCGEIQDYALEGLTTEQCDYYGLAIEAICICPTESPTVSSSPTNTPVPTAVASTPPSSNPTVTASGNPSSMPSFGPTYSPTKLGLKQTNIFDYLLHQLKKLFDKLFG